MDMKRMPLRQVMTSALLGGEASNNLSAFFIVEKPSIKSLVLEAVQDRVEIATNAVGFALHLKTTEHTMLGCHKFLSNQEVVDGAHDGCHPKQTEDNTATMI